MSQTDFIKQIAPIIQKYSKEFGYKVASPIIAQACLESAYGQSGLAKFFNFFGLKCGSKWQRKSVNLKTKEEYTVGTLTTIRDNFRAYDSMEEGVKGYFDFISTKRYANLKTATTPLQYLTFIKSDGYATSSSYVTNNMNVINKYNLKQYDEPTVINMTTLPTLRIGSRGDYVKMVQKTVGANTDGIFGRKTEEKVKEFQEKNGLVVDGIVGANTWAHII